MIVFKYSTALSNHPEASTILKKSRLDDRLYNSQHYN